ncbi:MAG TPA: helix-turn-helix transcriptional regulator [Acidimicrobiales bacterium]|nr:helix-turn-helix transcriptional regulator [Acidimicrobiales bacterium]
MDVSTDIRDFLTTRRARLKPQDVELPSYGGRRRVAGLRREEVALLAGISVEYYTRLERGNAAGASEDVLEGVARALRLDDAERSHLFDLVRTANSEQLHRSSSSSAITRACSTKRATRDRLRQRAGICAKWTFGHTRSQ